MRDSQRRRVNGVSAAEMSQQWLLSQEPMVWVACDRLINATTIHPSTWDQSYMRHAKLGGPIVMEWRATISRGEDTLSDAIFL
jgi:hypothetical protein